MTKVNCTEHECIHCKDDVCQAKEISICNNFEFYENLDCVTCEYLKEEA